MSNDKKRSFDDIFGTTTPNPNAQHEAQPEEDGDEELEVADPDPECQDYEAPLVMIDTGDPLVMDLLTGGDGGEYFS